MNPKKLDPEYTELPTDTLYMALSKAKAVAVLLLNPDEVDSNFPVTISNAMSIIVDYLNSCEKAVSLIEKEQMS